MDIDVTALFAADYSPRDYSASVAEIGASAGPTTWSNALKDSPEVMLLDTRDKRTAFRKFVRSAGAWTDAEIMSWSHAELNALLMQWIASDVREMFPDVRAFGDITPQQWREAAERGDGPSDLFRGDDGRIYFGAWT